MLACHRAHINSRKIRFEMRLLTWRALSIDPCLDRHVPLAGLELGHGGVKLELVVHLHLNPRRVAAHVKIVSKIRMWFITRGAG